MKRVYLVRHGQSEGNNNGFFQFHDTKLSNKGHEGAKAIAARLSSLEIDKILVSPMTRAIETASYIESEFNLVAEVCESSHELKLPTRILGVKKDSAEGLEFLRKRWDLYRSEKVTEDGFENFSQALERIKKTVSVIELAKEKNIVLVSHGNFLRMLSIYLLLQKSEDITATMSVFETLCILSNVGLSVFDYDGEKWKLFTWNDHAHFAE